MPSILPGYEYDIFISYRHNDNRSGWVTQFVSDLREELAATIKEPVSIYFDSNPHDSLLENHHVGKSIEGKLNCIIFIPILSQTYCDEKSFAWQHEFCAFNKLVKTDPAGRDIKLKNGNVASRILPIRTHDLDEEDRQTIKTEIQDEIRAIDFIYESSGVNRPLTPSDNPDKNLNHAFYRDQINKVARSVKDIISAIRKPSEAGHHAEKIPVASASLLRRKIPMTAIILAAVLIIFSFSYAILWWKPKASASHKSIAILPFDNLSSKNDEYISEGITDQIITSLGHVNGLKVASRTSSMQYKGSSTSVKEIAQALGVEYVVEGSVQKADDRLRISVRLIKAGEGFQEWNQTYNRTFNDILSVQDDIAQRVAEALGQLLDPSLFRDNKPANPEAYDHFLKGEFLWRRVESGSIRQAINEFKETVRLDPNFARGYSRIGFGYMLLESPWGDSNSEGLADSATYYNDKGLRINPDLADGIFTKATIIWWFGKNYPEAEQLLKLAYTKASDRMTASLNLGFFLNTQGRLKEALPYCEEGYKIEPAYLPSSIFLGDSYFLMKDYKSALDHYSAALNLYPSNPDPIYRVGWLYCSEGRFNEARTFLISNQKYFSWRDPRPQVYLAAALSKLGETDKATATIDTLLVNSKKGLPVFNLNMYLAVYYTFTNQHEKAYSYLENSLKKNEIDLIWLKVDPSFEPLRNDDRFKDILRRAGFK